MAKQRRRTALGDLLKKIAAIHGEPLPERIVLGGLADLERELKERLQLQEQRRQGRNRFLDKVFAPLLDLIKKDKEAVEELSKYTKVPTGKKKVTVRPPRVIQLEPQIKSGSIVTPVCPPFGPWTWESDSASNGKCGAGSAFADPNGKLTLTGQTGDDSISVAAGLGTQFQPLAANTFVRFSPFVQYSYKWHDRSNIRTAHNDAFLAIKVLSWNLQGQDQRTEIDQRMQLWSDGTGWEEEHSDQGEDLVYPTSQSTVYLQATNARSYAMWVWADVSFDASGCNDLFNSFASSELIISIPFMTFEQWT